MTSEKCDWAHLLLLPAPSLGSSCSVIKVARYDKTRNRRIKGDASKSNGDQLTRSSVCSARTIVKCRQREKVRIKLLLVCESESSSSATSSESPTGSGRRCECLFERSRGRRRRRRRRQEEGTVSEFGVTNCRSKRAADNYSCLYGTRPSRSANGLTRCRIKKRI
jgi:hypothetical protein